MDAFVCEALPEVDDVADISQRDRFLVGNCLADARYQFVKVLVQFIHPALVVALARGQGIDLGGDADNAGDVAGLRLRARHAAESGGHEEHPAAVVSIQPFLFQLLARCVHHGDGRSVHDALRAYVHV